MNKRKLITLSTISAAIAGSAAYLLKDDEKRAKLRQYISDQKQKYFTPDSREDNLPVEKAGRPHPENIPDNEMVDEGAQFGVQYYNAQQEKGRVSTEDTMKKSGHPKPTDTEDNKMVSEGAQFGVQYYEKQKESK